MSRNSWLMLLVLCHFFETQGGVLEFFMVSLCNVLPKISGTINQGLGPPGSTLSTQLLKALYCTSTAVAYKGTRFKEKSGKSRILPGYPLGRTN